MIKTVLTEDLFCRDLGYEPCEMILSDFLNLHVPPAHKDTPLNKKNDYFDNSDKLLFCTKFKPFAEVIIKCYKFVFLTQYIVLKMDHQYLILWRVPLPQYIYILWHNAFLDRQE